MSPYLMFRRTHVASLGDKSVKFKSNANTKTGVGVSILFNDAQRALSAAGIAESGARIKCDGAYENQFIGFL